MTWQRIALVALVQTIILVGMVVMRSAPYISGTEVLLRTEPVDPRDLMRGYYVQLGYDISRLSVTDDIADNVSIGSNVFVELVDGADGFWTAGAVYLERADVPDEVLAIRGEVQYVDFDLARVATATEPAEGPEPKPETAPDDAPDRSMSVTYGIERYYADRDLAQELQDMQREQRMSVAVGIAPSGAAGIRAILIDGERVSEEGLF